MKPNHTSSRCSALLLLALASGLAACGHESHSYSSSSTSFEGVAGTTIQAGGIEVVLDETVTYKSTTVTSSGSPTEQTTLVNGLEFELKSDRIVLGEQEFKGLVDGDNVTIGLSGIAVNGERRWDFPGE